MSEINAMAFGYLWTAFVILVVYGVPWRSMIRRISKEKGNV